LSSMIFNSETSPVPPLRRDVQIIPVEEEGEGLLLFYDPMMISTPGFALRNGAEPLLSLIDGHKSIKQLTTFFKNGADSSGLLEFVQMLDQNLLLNSPYFDQQFEKLEHQFEVSDLREPVLTGTSYPEDSKELKSFLDLMMNDATVSVDGVSGSRKALYAPHIDLRVGEKQYTEAFSSLKNVRPTRVVILATSHYSGYHPELYDGYPYIGSSKSYALPGRTFKTDQAYLERLSAMGDKIGFTIRDRAHRIEHSIETHLLFASHIWTHDFEVVPILVAGLDELFYSDDGDMSQKVTAFSRELAGLDTEDTFYLISGDLSHVGKKFGDPVPADKLRANVEEFDREFLNSAVENDAGKMLSQIAREYDPYRICGFPPLYTFLKSFPGLKGKRLNYHWWDEKERESAVSFGSIIY